MMRLLICVVLKRKHHQNLNSVLFICSEDLSLAVFLLPTGNSDDVTSIFLLVKCSDFTPMASLDGNELSEDDNLSELLALCLRLFPTGLNLNLHSDHCLLLLYPTVLFYQRFGPTPSMSLCFVYIYIV